MTATEIEAGTKQIEEAIGDYLCTHNQPCAAAVYYDEGEEKPWRIADDGASERFATVEEAVAGAEAWQEAMAAESATCPEGYHAVYRDDMLVGYAPDSDDDCCAVDACLLPDYTEADLAESRRIMDRLTTDAR
jgi:hypothetical protein